MDNNISKNDKDSTTQVILFSVAFIGALISIGMMTSSLSSGIIALIIDAAVWYFLFQRSMGTNGKWRSFSDENKRYAKQIMEYNEEIEFEEDLLDNLQSQLKEEENSKESRYFIKLMKL